MQVTVLTLDQRSSRDRADAVPSLLDTLAALPRTPLLGFERTVGDEVQGVVDDAGLGVEVVARVLRAGSWNVGIGVGEIEEPLPEGTRAGRGPAYIRAREAVTRAKSAPHRLTVVGAAGDPDVEALETVLGLWSGLVERRTDRGWEVHDLLATGMSHSEAGRRLGITQSAVSQRAQSAGLVDEVRARALAERIWDGLLRGAER